MSHRPNNASTARIRALNDLLRTTGIGGRVVLTSGVLALAPSDLRALVASVRSFDSFSPENDPYDEHDCAVLANVAGRFIWKIDYYDLTLTSASPDPSDPNQTARVLTIMSADEY